ncbi:M14 family metallopeptidase [Microbulbifer guangxiensis]|uniref:M14 family metallopeptidase n=1 Tax=Microbulbifer guangxiensis TaxID=2904249 RepID=UPI001F30056B|nr:M14 metallopeptidase family protein [Microbulbifer guangxiensis]
MARQLPNLLGVFLMLCSSLIMAAAGGKSYMDYKVPGLDKPVIRQADILPLIQELRKSPLLQVEEIGHSYEGRPIVSIAIGRGDTRVMLWSQMHGDEPTATPALFDLLTYITAPEQAEWREGWMDDLTLVMVPMLNPDGAERNTRHNAQSFDINRDAKALQSPEGRALMDLARSFEPRFGFNLHDQSRHYGVGQKDRMATISVLAPAYNEAREVNASRERAMKLIGALVEEIEPFIGEHIAKYDDTYAWRAFGDTFSEMGISTILIESGAHPNDPNRQVARHMNFEMLVAAIDSIAMGSYESVSTAVYDAIPFNREDAFVDVKIDNVRAGNGRDSYLTDIAINRRYGSVSVVEAGDLSNLFGALRFDAEGTRYQAPKAYTLQETLELTDQRYLELLRSGYGYFVGDSELLVRETRLPVVMNPQNPQGERPARRHGATFLLSDDKGVRVAVLDGELVDVRDGDRLLLAAE